jgi:hypothetical protein
MPLRQSCIRRRPDKAATTHDASAAPRWPGADHQPADRRCGFDEALTSKSIEAHIHNLRCTLQRSGATIQLETRRGIGYRLTEAAT